MRRRLAAVLAAAAATGAAADGLGLTQPLVDGVQARGAIDRWSTLYYAINLTVPLTRTDVTLEQLAGSNMQLYITLDGSLPTTFSNQYKTQGTSATKRVAIVGTDVQVQRYCPSSSGSSCPVTIAVVSSNAASNYTLVAASGATALLPSVPLSDQFAPAGTYKYYTLSSTDPNSPVTLSVTPISGDPDMFVSSSIRGSDRPSMGNASSYCAYSITARREVVELYPGLSPCWCGNLSTCVYTVGVLAYGPSDALFTVLGQTNTPAATTLLDGVPQLGYTLAGSSQQFTFAAQFNASAGIKAVEITLNPLLGDGDLYVALNGLPASSSNFAYLSTKGPGQADSVVIRPSDKQFQRDCGAGAAACALTVGVYAYSTTLWSLVASNAFYVTLADGVPQRASVDEGDYAFFRYTLTDAATALVVSVDQVSGDSDLFVGCGANFSTPTDAPGSFIWSSTGVGTEVVYIPPTDKRACPATADYFVGVTSFSRNATFSVTARSRSTRPAQLALGQPVVDLVRKGEYAYYSFAWDWARTVAWIEVSPSLGDSDLLVTLNGSLPSLPALFAYSSQSATGLEQVTISSVGDPVFAASPCGAANASAANNCTVTIAVYGFSESRYSLTAWTSLRQLDDGVPVVATVSAGDADYFYYVASDRSVPFSFFVTPLDAGDPDLYISVSGANQFPANQFPNASAYNWTSNSPGSEAVHINPATDPQLAAYGPGDYPLTFYAAVEAWGRAPATFSVVATSSPAVELADGVPVGGSGVAFSLTYFSFFVPPPPAGQPGKSFEVMLVPISGGPADLYINDEPARPYPVCTGSCATGVISNYHWTSTGGPVRSRALVSRGDRFYATNRAYVVAVYAEAAVSYTISAAFTDSIRTLSAGVPLQDSVAPSAAMFYRLLLRQPGADVAISVTPITGDPDLYVSVHAATPRPGPGPGAGFDKKSTGSAGSTDSVYFQWQELAECQVAIAAGGDCDVWVGVWGFAGAGVNTTYSITATVAYNQNNASMLVDGEPQAGNVTAGRYAYYWALVSVPPGQTYSVSVRPTSGDADLYVRTDALTVPGWPSSSNYQYASSNSVGDDYVNVMPGTAGYNASALLRVAVLGYSAAASYVITFATYAAVAQLADGVALVGTLPRGGAAYYSFANPSRGVDLAFALTALSADPDIYVSPWPAGSPRFRPGPGAGGSPACRAGTRYGSDTVEVYSTGGDPCYCAGCTYIIGTYCAIATGSCRYSITGSTVSPYSLISLADGRPSSNAVRQWGFKYFSYDARFFNGTQRTVTLRLVGTGGAGAVRAFVTNAYVPGVSPVGALPTNVSGYQWASPLAGPQAGVVTIAFNDSAVTSCVAANGAGGLNCSFYTIAVQGLAGGSSVGFTLTGSSTDSPQLLVPGLPSAPAEVGRGGAQHFAVDLDDASSDLVVAVTVLSGRVALSLDPRNPATGCTGLFTAVACDGVWANPSNAIRPAGSATLIRVSAAAPCAGPWLNPSAPGFNCTYAPGRYFIGVYGVFAATFTVTVLEAAGLVQLEEGVPFSDAVSSLAPVTAVYRPVYQDAAPSIKLSLDASGADVGLVLYVTSCVEGILGPLACNTAARAPGPSNYDAFLAVDSGTAQDLIITKHSPAFCVPGSPGLTCSYYAAIAPGGPGDCNPPSCDGSFTLAAQQDAPGARSQIPAASTAGRVAENIGVVAAPQGSVNYYEIFLSKNGDSSGAGVTLNVSLDACGPAFASLYFCDPAPGGGSACSDTFAPSRASHTGAALFTAAATGSGGVPGRAVGSLTGVTSSALYAAVTADGALSSAGAAAAADGAPLHARLGGGGGGGGGGLGQVPPIGGQYVLTLSTGPNVTYLYPPLNASVSVVVTGYGTTLNVSWAAPLIGDVGAPGVGVPAAGVTYTVYAAPVSFAAAAAAAVGGAAPPLVVATTACGLDMWGRVTGLPPVVVVGQTWAELADLAPNSAYQVNVAATCSNACWAANGIRATRAAGSLVLGGGSGGGGGGALGAPGYNTQRLAYAPGSATTGAGGAPVTQGTPTGVIAAAVAITLLALAGAAFAYARYRRGKTPDYSAQYDSLDVSAAMSTISTPATAGVAQLRSAGSALLSSLRSLLTVPGGGGGYARPAALAGQDDGMQDDPRVAGFM